MAIRGSLLSGVIIPVGGPAGLPGQSTYDAWRALGNTGSLADFVAAQKGLPGGVTTLAGKIGALSLDDIGALPANGNVSGTSVVLATGATRNTAQKLFERRSIADYYETEYQGDYAPAIEAAAADGVVELVFPASGFPYTLHRTFNIPNGSMKLVAEGCKQVELRLLGANDYHGIIGNGTTESYNFHICGFVFTKEQASSQGAVLKLINVYKWSFSHVRIYGENKIWRVLELLSSSAGISHDVDVDSILESPVYALGGTAAFGTPGGGVIDNLFDLWYVIGAQVNPAVPTAAGLFNFVDCYQAQWITNLKAAKFNGYAVNWGGTVANRGINCLNIVLNPNVEASGTVVGVVRFGAVASSQVGGPASWVSCTATAAFLLTADSQDNTVEGMQIGVGGAGGKAFSDAGLGNNLQDYEAVGYDSLADCALSIEATARKGRYLNFKVAQLQRVIADQSPDTAGHVIRSVDYTAITGQPLTGLAGGASSNKVVEGINNLDADAPTIAAAATLNLPHKGKVFVVNTAGTIQKIVPTYIRQEITLLLAQANTVIQNLQGAAGAGAFYLRGGNADFANTSVPAYITLIWMGDYWWEVARSG